MSDRPPPLPTSRGVTALKAAAAELDVEEILGLCFAFAAEPPRLTVYLDVLRGKGGPKAQAAACLVCFDLARRGDERFQAEFLALVPTLVRYAEGGDGGRPVDELIGHNTYLLELWTDLEPRLKSRDRRLDDARVEEVVETADPADAIELDLLDDSDRAELADLDILDVDDEAMGAAWRSALDVFLGFGNEPGSLRGLIEPAGFRAERKEELRAVERFHDAATSLADHVGAAREMLPLVDLFLAAHTRARNFFGTRNKVREAMVQRGLTRFGELTRPSFAPAGFLVEPYGAPHAWDKVAEILLDYVAFLGSLEKVPPEGLPAAYVRANRPQPPPPRLADGTERRRR